MCNLSRVQRSRAGLAAASARDRPAVASISDGIKLSRVSLAAASNVFLLPWPTLSLNFKRSFTFHFQQAVSCARHAASVGWLCLHGSVLLPTFAGCFWITSAIILEGTDAALFIISCTLGLPALIF